MSHPSIRWSQSDAELTKFMKYQVQILDESGTIVVDSEEIEQVTTAKTGFWTPEQALPANQALQIQVRVKDEHAWSEWSSVGWMKVHVKGVQDEIVVSASSHSIMRKNDGTVWTWGANTSGQLGDGTLTDKTAAVQVPGLNSVVSVAAGEGYSLALKEDGTVWAWGDNTHGQLGEGNQASSLVPIQVSGLVDVVAIETEVQGSYALKRDGTVWKWGRITSWGTGAVEKTPVRVANVTGVKEIVAGDDYVAVLKTDGTVWAWGAGWTSGKGWSQTGVSTPTEVVGLDHVASIAGGVEQVLAVKTDGTLWYWGYLGNHSSWYGYSGPTKMGITDVAYVAANQGMRAGGTFVNVVVKKNGTVWAWGTNKNGELGDGTINNNLNTVPQQVAGISDVSTVAVGNGYVLASKSDGSLWSWGLNNKGQLGDGTTTTRTRPVQVKLDTSPVVKLTYPLGSQAAPSVTESTYPTIGWEVVGLENEKFETFEVQLLNSNGEIFVESGELTMDSSTDQGYWTVDEALLSSELVQVRVRVGNDTEWLDWSQSKWLQSVSSPLVPNLHAIPTSNSLIINWSEILDADGYEIEINGELISSDTTTYTKAGLESGQDYSIRVRAIHGKTIGEWSEVLTVKALLEPSNNVEASDWTDVFKTTSKPAKTEGLRGESLDVGLIINWSVTPGATEYEVNINGEIYTSISNRFEIAHNDVGFKYSIRVRGKNEDGEGEWSEVFSIMKDSF